MVPWWGRFIVNYAKTFFTGVLPDFWLFFLGGLFIAVTLFLQKGVIGAVPAIGSPDRKSVRSGITQTHRGSQHQRRRQGMSDAIAVEVNASDVPQVKSARAETILYVDGVSVTFDGFRALNNLSFYIEPGELRAIIGPNGAGKTTMMDIITGKTRPDTGDVLFKSEIDLTKLDEAEIANLGIGRKLQKPTLFESHTVVDNLFMAASGGTGVLQAFMDKNSGWKSACC